MFKKILVLLIIILAILLLFAFCSHAQELCEKGSLAIYFLDSQVGYEEFSWFVDEGGFLLQVQGKMTKPVELEIESLEIRVSRDFIPEFFELTGTVNGVRQHVSSVIRDGTVENTIEANDQKSQSEAQIRRDAFLLPNPIFSPYMIITKKFRCSLPEKVELSAYIIPQLETSFTLEPGEGQECSLTMEFSGLQIEMETDSLGKLRSILIPAQNLKVIAK